MIHGTGQTRRRRTPDTSGQRSFMHLREQELGPSAPLPVARRLAHEEAVAKVDERGAGSVDPVRDEAVGRIKSELMGFLSRRGLGREVTGVDFTNWLDACGLRPDPKVLDLRVTGGWWRTLMHKGVLSLVGYRPNGGGKGSEYSSTPRPFYRIDRLPTLRDLDAAPITAPTPDPDPHRRPAA